MRRPIRTSLLAVAWLVAGIGVAAGEPTAPATSPAPANPAAPVTTPTTPSPVMPPAPATSAVPDARPSPPGPVTIRRPVAAKPCVSATRKLEREQSSLETAEADVARYRKLQQGCRSKLTCARYAAALKWLDNRVDRHQRRIERFATSRHDACKDI